MPNQRRQAGQNIRELALKRRAKSIISLTSALLIIVSPPLIFNAFNNLVKQLISTNTSQAQPSLNVLTTLYIFLLFVALGLIVQSAALWKQANNAVQGAKGEETIGDELSKLVQEGWEIEYGIRLGNRLGDADVICISPRNKTYVIDVKSHKGDVIMDGEQLYRRMGKTTYAFEKDFIRQTMKQALEVRRQKSLDFVTPILAFSDARVLLASDRIRNVYVVEKSRLTALLRSLG